ncbi:MAG: NAD(P)-binding domain-containing protein [Phycisphaerales bacterium]|nr:NAD(P)-binding domain-containing protein [Phycisphaerales bacterium]
MNWALALAPMLVVLLTILAVLRRRGEVRAYARRHLERLEAKERGSDRARLQHPEIDLSQCIGCGACVRACPEEGVLGLMHGQAVIVHGARCVGHGRCADACPTAAIALTLGDLSDRRDLPAVHEDLEAVNVPGLFLAGELSGFALVRTAVSHGVTVADAVSRRRTAMGPASAPRGETVHELLIVGAGPAGVACSLRAKELGVAYLTIEQSENIGGTVASYPRRKLVMTQPVELPLYGRMDKSTYQKEELIGIWEGLARDHGLNIRTGVQMMGFARRDDGLFVVNTSSGEILARHVCLALGRRGTPRKLGVPGEDLPKVAYSLLDAESYRDRQILVVGGGDSAIEAAVGLAEQPGNHVTLSYRKHAFFRLKARNERQLAEAIGGGRLRVVYESEVESIGPGVVHLRVGQNGSAKTERLANDEVFVFAGGVPPFQLLQSGGVSFDPDDRPESTALANDSRGFLYAQIALLIGTALVLFWAVIHSGYYGAPLLIRPSLASHHMLRPSGPIGLMFGVLAVSFFVFNLTYLVKRSVRWGRWLPGTLRGWMNAHVFTGVSSLLCVLVHCGFALRNVVGGHALVALIIVVVTGAIGRYIYAFIPRAANGREVDLDEVRTRLVSMSSAWDEAGRGYGEEVRREIDHLIHAGRWRPGLLARVGALISGQVRLSRTLRRLRAQGRTGDIPGDEIRDVTLIARRAYRLSLMVTHYEELRALLSSWRYFHRWLALLMVLLTIAHVATALRYADLRWKAHRTVATASLGGDTRGVSP